MNIVRITVVKCLNFNDIHSDSNLECSADMAPVCERFAEGQVFETDMQNIPEGFCPFAFIDISKFISGLRSGADYEWMNEKGTVLACCTDGFRPVVFRLERIEC